MAIGTTRHKAIGWLGLLQVPLSLSMDIKFRFQLQKSVPTFFSDSQNLEPEFYTQFRVKLDQYNITLLLKGFYTVKLSIWPQFPCLLALSAIIGTFRKINDNWFLNDFLIFAWQPGAHIQKNLGQGCLHIWDRLLHEKFLDQLSKCRKFSDY